jgi:K+-sensing histidine kinase KdpD
VPLGDDLAQIVTNLALNALAHAPKGSELRIVTTSQDRSVTIDVEDDGPGISAERSFSVFEGDSTRQGGAGVGLRHARAIARAAGGDLRLLEQLDGAATAKGAVFRVEWPRDIPTNVGEPRISRPKLQVLAGTCVLIVEDDRDVTNLLESALEARGAEVTIARTAAELAERIHARYTAVLVDLSPIANDVAGAIALVKREAKDAAIVFITGSAEALPEGMEEAAWLRKPFEVGELVTILSRVSITRP